MPDDFLLAGRYRLVEGPGAGGTGRFERHPGRAGRGRPPKDRGGGPAKAGHGRANGRAVGMGRAVKGRAVKGRAVKGRAVGKGRD